MVTLYIGLPLNIVHKVASWQAYSKLVNILSRYMSALGGTLKVHSIIVWLNREARASLKGQYPCSFGDQNILDVHASDGKVLIGGSNAVRHYDGISTRSNILSREEDRALELCFVDLKIEYGNQERGE